MSKLIGFGHTAQVGKDTAAFGIGYKRLAFADEVRGLLLQVNPLVHDMPLQGYINVNGWETAKADGEVRRLLQNIGLGAREILGEDVWVKPVMSKAKALLKAGVDVAITDVRFPNEHAAIRKAGGTLIKITRPGSPKMSHLSETALEDADWDHVIENNFTIDHLVHTIRAIIDELP